MMPGCVEWPEEVAERYRREGYWRGETLGDLLRRLAGTHGAKTALVSGDSRWSYAELDARADRLAAGLRELGVGRGDRVLVQLPNIPELVFLCFALFRVGAAPVLALPPHRHSEIGPLAEAAGAVAYVVPDTCQGFDHRELARQVRASTPSLLHVIVVGDPQEFTALADVERDPVPLAPPDPGDVALFLLSGGTTGRSKLIPRTHDDYVCNIRVSAENAGLNETSVYLAALPVAHNYALGCPGVLGTLHAGGTVVLTPTPSPDDAFALIERERVTVTGLVPSLAQLWVEAAGWSRQDLSSLRLVQVGGAALSGELAHQVGGTLGRLQQSFGMAEGLLSQSRPDDPREVLVSTQGRPLTPADEVRVVGKDGRDVPRGEVGELLVRGPYTIRGYYRAPEHNAAAFTSDGFFRSGDLARLTDTGHLVIAGRVKDVINRGGDKVPAEEVEDHLLAHPEVHAVAVVAMPDPLLGERTCAYIVPRGGAPSLKTIQTFLRKRGVAAYKVPDWVEDVSALPYTPVGKVDKARLRADIAHRRGGRRP
ncbi:MULTISPECIES: (2,3-dihydroxybenzoyl)adenylate synthase [Streptosporangium]|uniref:2,3-dihydroxybenzoate-AMP ligase n=1 Tax=Streptosporangium brasiliense TaxID=47480 RepID=A0ABT9RN93_9ACTN|nr:AMP-binding protein [Streptosporangium brasiliense]MDP9870184.1 2,3-dihydroxybenzoate-AMP ligase [Streptosporangium brasiliense]